MSKETVDIIIAFATISLALFTAGLMIATFKAVREGREASLRQIEASRTETTRLIEASRVESVRQIGVQTWLQLQKKFDSLEMVQARKRFSEQLKSYHAGMYDDVSDTVPNFFEDVGVLHKLGYLDKGLADSSFGLYATRYWEAVKPYIDQQRRLYGDDGSIYEHFKDFAAVVRLPGEKIDDGALKQFLDDESKLQTDSGKNFDRLRAK